MRSRGWRSVIAGGTAKHVTSVLLLLQLGGCIFDATHRQLSLLPAFCTVTKNGWLEAAAVVIILVLTFSWIAGLLGLRFPMLRLVYWTLLVAIPFAFGGQMWLLRQGVLGCDTP